jgi:hypothetical protein
VTGEARYLYCVVDASGNDPDSGAAADPAAFTAEGLDDAPVRVLRAGDASGDGESALAAVVHDCDGLYDTDDETTLRRWLLAHQRVVDAAMASFGAPLPVRFDTVLEGGDDTVRGWLDAVGETARAGLGRVAGCREYRTIVQWTVDTETFEADARARDDRLAELASEREAASEGRGFLLQKQYDARLRECRRERVADLSAALREAVDPVARAVESTDGGSTSASGATAAGSSENGGGTVSGAAEGDGDGDDGGIEVARLSILAPLADEDRLGERLDAYVADRPVAVQFTGPWAPYSFVPELG